MLGSLGWAEGGWVLHVKQVLENLYGRENSKGNSVEEQNLKKMKVERK